MFAALCLSSLALAQDGAAIQTYLNGFEELAVEYAQGGAILRTWLPDAGGALRGSFRVLDQREEPAAAFEPERLHGWPMAWTFAFRGGVAQDAFLAGPNQLHHAENGRLTLDADFVARVQSGLAAAAGGAIALRRENPLPEARQDAAVRAQATLARPWTAARVEVRGGAQEDVELDGTARPLRLVLTGVEGSLPDGGAKLTLRDGEGEELALRQLQASRSRTLVYDHSWMFMTGVGAVWVPNDWLRPVWPDLPSLAPMPAGEDLARARALLDKPLRLASELELVALETRPVEGEYGPPRSGKREAPVARMPTRVWGQATLEPIEQDAATWRRRVADLERRGAARVLVRGEGEAGPWELSLVPLSETEALVPPHGKLIFPSEGWSDLVRVVASRMGVDDARSLRLVPR